MVVRVTAAALASAVPRALCLPAPMRARLAAAALAAYPREACGLLIGRIARRAVEVVAVTVEANAADDPMRAFVVPPAAWFAAADAAEARGLAVVGAWHAHPDGAALPSAADARAAWNDHAQVIVAVTRAAAGELRAFFRRNGVLREQTVCTEVEPA